LLRLLHGGLGGGFARVSGDSLAVLEANLLVGRHARLLGADLRRGVLVGDDDRTGIVEGLLVLAWGGVAAVLQSEAIARHGGRGEEEQRGRGARSLGGDATVAVGRGRGGKRRE